ncbi:RnfABCDGE type electron transport complex subunit D [Candidatus Poribacteria bacterium]
MEDSRLIVSTSPHIRDKDSISKIMWTVVISLVPAVIAGTYFFGLRVLMLVLISVATAVATEAVIQRLMRKDVTVSDGSAVITGMLLAMVISPSSPFWMPIIGSFSAIAISKCIFGGLGHNIFNPALVGRAVLLASFPVAMTKWVLPAGVDALTTATPLAMIKDMAKEGSLDLAKLPSVWNMFMGRTGGSAGETCALALLIGAAILLARRIITWHIPISYIGTVAVIIGLSQLFGGQNFAMIPIHILSGGLILGAFFMATDMVTSPLTKKGGVVFGIGAGVLTCLIRLLGGYPEGVCYSILLMNAFSPLIDRYIRPRRFGIEGLKA